MITVRPGSVRDITYVAANMRDADRREIFCQRADEDVRALAMTMSYVSPVHCYAAFEDCSPIAVFGASEQHPNMWTAWAFGTRRLRRAVPAITRFVRSRIAGALLDCGANRVEVRSIAGHDIAHRWLETLGAEREALLRGFGKGGEDFVLYAWRRDRFSPRGRPDTSDGRPMRVSPRSGAAGRVVRHIHGKGIA